MLLIYNDVIRPIQCELLIEEFESNPEKKVANPDVDQFFDDRVLFLQRMTPDIQSFVASLTMELVKLLNHHFRTVLYPETVSIVRWDPGQEMALHQDGQNPHTINRSHAVLIYLNAQEDGGEIYFPELGTTVKPRVASMVAYGKTVLHGVKPVLTPRYTLTLWFSEQPECSIISSSQKDTVHV